MSSLAPSIQVAATEQLAAMRPNFLSLCCLKGGDAETLLTTLEEHGDYDEERFSGFDFLPDEVVVHIFSFLTSGHPLVDAVPLVCRRWNRLARDPQAWSRVEVWLSGAYSDDVTEARVLLHAPALSRLELVAVGARQESALRRGRFVVLHQVDARGLFRSGANAKLVNAVLGVVWRSRQHLRAVNLHLGLVAAAGPRPSVATILTSWLQPPPVRYNAYRVLAGMGRLRELHLSFPKEAPLPYRRRLETSLDLLSVLTVDLWWDPTLLCFLDDALRSAAPSLRCLRVWLKSGRGDMLDAVAQCTNLQGLFVLGTYGTGLSGLRRLQGLTDLRLLLYSEDVPAALVHLADAKDLAYDLPRLQKLWITFAWNQFKSKSLSDMLAESAEEFLECRPGVNSTWDTV